MGEMKLGANEIGKIYLGDTQIITKESSIKDKYLFVVRKVLGQHEVQILDSETLQVLKTATFSGTNSYKLSEGIFSMKDNNNTVTAYNGSFSNRIAYINVGFDSTTDHGYDFYADWQQFVYITNRNYNLFTKCRSSFHQIEKITSDGMLGDETVSIVGRYNNYYVCTNNWSKLFYIKIVTSGISIEEPTYIPEEIITAICTVGDYMYCISDSSNWDSFIFKYKDKEKIKRVTNIVEYPDGGGTATNLSQAILFFDGHLVAFDYYGNYHIYDLDLNVVSEVYDDSANRQITPLVVNDKLWLVDNLNGNVVIRENINDRNNTVSKHITVDDGILLIKTANHNWIL